MRFLKAELKSKWMTFAVLFILSFFGSFGMWVLRVDAGIVGNFLDFWLKILLDITIFTSSVESISLAKKFAKLKRASKRCDATMDEIIDGVYIFSFHDARPIDRWTKEWLEQKVDEQRASVRVLRTYAISDDPWPKGIFPRIAHVMRSCKRYYHRYLPSEKEIMREAWDDLSESVQESSASPRDIQANLEEIRRVLKELSEGLEDLKM